MTEVNDKTINLAYCINDIARYFRTCFDREMSQHGLTRSQWWLLANLQYNNGSSQQDLAEIMELGKSGTGKLIDQLEKKGWVERKPNPEDKRAYKVYLTEAVQPLIKDIDLEAHTLIERSLSELSERQRTQLQKLLDSVKGQLLQMNNGATR
ncbi:MarR family transcriptional regulator [Pseudomaricurvus alkylphenolicus]|jgi:DNA-binding MarR family transcriptional regulator|uniref:MarR family winged helix-turn-helix transcriptional regulator n=1 Tax=Pseudomaricurvus alkylphenolicus TaxID=1306991 RepID=UPI0014243B8F|nr:MarR family transcriptional regulator [Pseudomaricurvus alkylphenolicus]NIB44305.1 MarR family transcriptional regulator [Pseudomaricurvus alkylphenolicus]